MNNNVRVFVYSEYPSIALNFDLLTESLRAYGFHVEYRGNLIEYLCASEQTIYNLARDLSSTEISDISLPLDTRNPFNHSEIETELNKILGRATIRGKFYDGYWVQRILHHLLNDNIAKEPNKNDIHLIITGRLFGTFEDRRYHARVVLLGSPSMISTSGLVEAPAKPREYYYVKGRMTQSGMDTSELDSHYKGRFVEYNDPKITSILISYALQVIVYELTGRAFCDDPQCCLTNSHWQEEVLKVQYEGSLCSRCEEPIKS